jgi:hypothetical protein
VCVAVCPAKWIVLITLRGAAATSSANGTSDWETTFPSLSTRVVTRRLMTADPSGPPPYPPPTRSSTWS